MNVHARHEQGFGPGASDREHLNLRVRPGEALLQVENDLAAFDPEQMVPRAIGTALDKPDSEDIDVPRRDLERVATVIEQFWMATIECDVTSRTGSPFLIARRPGLLEERFAHSCATNLAYAP